MSRAIQHFPTGVLAVAAFVLGAYVASPLRPPIEGPKANLALTAPAAEIVAVDTASTREFVRADDGLFYVEARLNGAPVRFVVDTGATVVVLTPDDARRIGVATQGASDNIRTVSGAAPMKWARIDKVEMAGREMDSVDVAVTDSNLKTSLLGQNVLSKLGVVTINGDRLIIN